MNMIRLAAALAAAPLLLAAPPVSAQSFDLADTLPAPPAADQPPAWVVEEDRAIRAQEASDLRRARRDAIRWETAFIALSAADLIISCDAINRGVAHEVGPASWVFGKDASCEELVATKLVTTGLQYLLYRRALAKDPRKARLIAQLSAGGQGIIVGLNIPFAFKGG